MGKMSYIKNPENDSQKLINAKNREKRKRGNRPRDYSKDGSTITPEMARARGLLRLKQVHAEKVNPFTSHPLTFEEIDSIPDITDIKNKHE